MQSLDPVAPYESFLNRGLVYLAQNKDAAANEFSGFMRWLDTQPPSVREHFSRARGEWMASLRAGRNPFNAQTLQRLRASR